MQNAKTVKAVAAVIMSHWFSGNPAGSFGTDGLRAPELAAWLGLDEELTYRAVARLVREGELEDRGDLGIFRVAQRPLFPARCPCCRRLARRAA